MSKRVIGAGKNSNSFFAWAGFLIKKSFVCIRWEYCFYVVGKSDKCKFQRRVNIKMINFIKNEVTGWKKWEVSWLFIACIVITGLSIYWEDTPMGIISATTGVACVVCTGKGKLSAYIFGLVNCVLYAIISYQAALYGETMLNAIYYIPMQFVGFYIWSKHMDSETKEVEKRHLNWKGRLLLVCVMCIMTFGYGLFLENIGDAMPFVDAFTTVSSVIAMIISVKMFAEQWWIWIAVDIFSVYMWWCNFRIGGDNVATLLMWMIYLGNAVIMLIKWEKESHKEKKYIKNYFGG